MMNYFAVDIEKQKQPLPDINIKTHIYHEQILTKILYQKKLENIENIINLNLLYT